jgi:hypothetical protein
MLKNSPKQVQNAVIECCDREFIECICECAHNVLKGSVPITDHQKQQLTPHRHNLRELTKKKTSTKRRKEILQEGGFLGAILTPILSVLGGLFKQ